MVVFSMDICKTNCNSLFPVPSCTVYRMLLALYHPHYVEVQDFQPLLFFYQSKLFCWIHPSKNIHLWSLTILSWREASRMWLLQAAVPVPACVQMQSVSADFCTERVRILLSPISSVFGVSTEDKILLLGSGGQPHAFLSPVNRNPCHPVWAGYLCSLVTHWDSCLTMR